MFEKAKKFYEENKKQIVVIGSTILVVGVVIGKLMKKPINLKGVASYDDSADRAILEGFGAIFKDGFGVPFATKEVATKFLEERGDTYQVDILDDLTSVIWISK